MRVTSKGQVTIPIEIRQRLGILPETELEFSVSGDKGVFKKAAPKNGRPSRGERAVALLAGAATDRSYTTDEILAMTRGDD
jgi:AbrB family looped-hinge helix DNA binding protein